VCEAYPTFSHYMPPECTYYFVGGERRGECGCMQGACCAIPREGGVPGGVPLPEAAGGEPCKYLVYVDVEVPESEEKVASESEGYVKLAEAIGGTE
jgi:hypothetical protein